MRDLFEELPPREAVEKEALRLWREREALYPAFVRRLVPDELDRIMGAWDLMLVEAAHSLAGRATVHLTK